MKRSIGAKTIVYPTPVFLVGSYDQAGQPNIMTAAWAGICCSRPPCVAVSLRRATHSHAGLMARRAFTLSIPSQTQVREADYAGLVSGRDGDKFKALGLTPKRSELVDAPFVEECPMVLECKVLHVHELGLHTQFVGEILDVKADEDMLDGRGQPDIRKVRPILYAPGTQEYFSVGELLGPAFSIGKK